MEAKQDNSSVEQSGQLRQADVSGSAISTRDYFAGLAMQAYVRILEERWYRKFDNDEKETDVSGYADEIALWSYKFADAMMAERDAVDE